jgi:hypothetical protein
MLPLTVDFDFLMYVNVASHNRQFSKSTAVSFLSHNCCIFNTSTVPTIGTEHTSSAVDFSNRFSAVPRNTTGTRSDHTSRACRHSLEDAIIQRAETAAYHARKQVFGLPFAVQGMMRIATG